MAPKKTLKDSKKKKKKSLLKSEKQAEKDMDKENKTDVELQKALFPGLAMPNDDSVRVI